MIVEGTGKRVDAGVWMVREGEEGGRLSRLRFPVTLWVRRVQGTLWKKQRRQGTHETQLQGNLHAVGVRRFNAPKALSIAEIGPSVDTDGAIKQPRSLSLVEG